jgi:hypothetical protein
MNRLLLILILTFSFQTFSKADDIKDFEIEGISIGDSLLEYFSIGEIKRFDDYDDLPSNMKFRIATITKKKFNKINTYDSITFYYKPGDEDFIIHAIGGNLFCKNDECKKLYKEIKNDFLKEYKGTESVHKHPDDKSGKSITTIYTIKIDEGSILILYNSMSKNVKWVNDVSVEISRSEVDEWIRNKWGLGLK